MAKKTLTTNQGVPVADNQSSLTAGQRGPILQIPINRPKFEVNNNQRDGAMQNGAGFTGTVNYEPNTLGGGMPMESGMPRLTVARSRGLRCAGRFR